MLPGEYPPNKTGYPSFRQWRNDGTGEQIHARLREQERRRRGREPTPSAAIVDSHSITIAEHRGWRGYEGGKKSHGRRGPARTSRVVCSPLGPDLGRFWLSGEDWVRERFGWDMELVTHRWTGSTGVWAKEGTVIAGEAIRPSGCPCASSQLGSGANIRLALAFTTVSYRL